MTNYFLLGFNILICDDAYMYNNIDTQIDM